jgi:hypothetical protein
VAWQQLIVGLIVAGAFAYTAWAVMPRAWRHPLLRRLGRRVPDAGSGCGACDNCGPKPSADKAQVIRVHRR